MTWLTGSTTWGVLEHQLTQLICGEVADGSSTTVAVGSRWVREVTRTVTDGVITTGTTLTSATAAFSAADVGSLVIATGVPLGTTISAFTSATQVTLSATATNGTALTVQIATNTIRTPAAKDVVASGAMSNRTGYFANTGATAQFMAAPNTNVARVTSPYTADPSTSGFHRWVVRLTVSSANTVSGNYSTANISYFVTDADSQSSLANSSTAPSAAGVLTLPGQTGLQISLTDPSGFLTVGTVFIRAFSATYMYGIDPWPMYYRATAAVTFSVAPPGVAGTDYDVLTLANPFVSTSPNDRGNLFHGLGIKTATANTGALYTLSHPMALAKCRIFSAGVNGQLSLDVGQSKKDSVNGNTFRVCGGVRVTAWAKCFQTPASVTAASQLQYWLSVTSDGIFLVLNGDPGSSGKLGTAWLGAYVPTEPTYDVFPVAFSYVATDYTADQSGTGHALATQYPYWSLRRRQDGSEGSRDWQTKWMRADHLTSGGSTLVANNSGMLASDVVGGGQVAPATTTSSIPMLSALGASSNVAAASKNTTPTRQAKPGPDGKWWLYGFQYGEGDWESTSSATADEARLVRGTQQTRYLYVSGDGWGSGDELTDTGTGTKYLLLVPDYAGPVNRVRTAVSTWFGGTAIAEV